MSLLALFRQDPMLKPIAAMYGVNSHPRNFDRSTVMGLTTHDAVVACEDTP